MKKLYILFFVFFPLPSFADVYKCFDGRNYSYSTSPCLSGSMPYKSDSSASSGSFSVNRARNGVYVSSGSVNGFPVNFVLDTGASFTTIAGDTAFEMGIKTCQVVGYVSTGNGVSGQCSMTLNSLSVGNAEFHNVRVLIAPNMRGQSLIGNDLLSRFKVQQQDGVMTLSR